MLPVWKARNAAVGEEIAPAERAAKAIQDDGNRLVRTGVTAPAFSYLREIETGNERECQAASPLAARHGLEGAASPHDRPLVGRAHDRAARIHRDTWSD